MKNRRRVAVLGFGTQGRALALNLRDSGYEVVVGLRRNSRLRAAVRKEGIAVSDLLAASKAVSAIIIALPDHIQPLVLNSHYFQRLKEPAPLVFLHGTAIHFGLVCPPTDWPVLLLAPHAPGAAVRENYLMGRSFSAFCAVAQGSKKREFARLKELGGAIGVPKSHLIKTTFAAEAVGDIFGEQAVLCGGLARLLKLGFETLTEAGLPPQNAYLEVAYQLDLIVALVKKHGLTGMLKRISPLARYGAVVNGAEVIPDEVKKRMKKLLAEIESGAFLRRGAAKNWRYGQKQMGRLTSQRFDRQAIKMARLEDD